ncbi:MAG: elongation factor G [Chloroflexi bacterium]|nr:elongation factor G [Chloroflexota bacterium]
MQEYALENIRNVVLLSHSGAGKTSLSEAILFNTGVINRLGKVDDGSTTSDYDPEEIKRRISLNLSILPSPWGKDHKINFLDTPGYSDLIGEVRAGLRVSEGAVIVVCAAAGIEVGTEQVWAYCEEANLPRLIFINKMDRENADFYRTVAAIQSKFGAKCLPVQLPIGVQNTFQGVVNLLTRKSYAGTQATEGEAPDTLQSQINTFREKLVEAIAEIDDKLIEKYLGGEELSLEELTTALKKAVRGGRIVPILTGSGLKNIGLPLLLESAVNFLPSPAESEIAITGGKSPTIKPGYDGSLATLVFKTSADPYVGKLSYLRVYSGIIESNSNIWNATRGEGERIGQLYTLRGKTQEPVPRLRAGDIGVVAKLGVTNTGDTLGNRDNPLKLPPVSFPAPVYSAAVYPKTKTDIDKMGNALARMVEEDQTVHIRRDPDTGETIISGIGETHLAVVSDRMARKFGLGAELKTPKVPYRETITVPTKAEYKHRKQTGGHGQYGHVMMELEPLPIGTPSEFAEKVVGGSVPKNYFPAVEKGVNEGFKEGVLAGYPVTGVRAILYDGSYHPVDSSEICFKIAGAGALKKGLAQANPILLEPIMNIKVIVPEEYTGDIIGDLNTKRARVSGMNPHDGRNEIDAQVPLAEVQRYAIDLKSITQGRGTFTMSFSHYEVVPAHITQKIVAERQAEKAAVAAG